MCGGRNRARQSRLPNTISGEFSGLRKGGPISLFGGSSLIDFASQPDASAGAASLRVPGLPGGRVEPTNVCPRGHFRVSALLWGGPGIVMIDSILSPCRGDGRGCAV